jgi:hypothetical protein
MPNSVNIEQSSGYETAKFKSNIFNFNSSLDLTSGFGIDSYFFALKADHHLAIESDSNLCKIANSNFKNLHLYNTSFICSDAETFLEKNVSKFDLVYIDPSRRTASGQRKIQLSNYSPDVTKLFHRIKEITRYLIVKLSPMLDITILKKEFPSADKFYVISINGECKELLMVFDFISHSGNIQYHTVELGNSKFEHIFEDENDLEINYSMSLDFIYDVHPAIKKSGFYDNYAMSLGLSKLSRNSHLYTSEDLKSNFQGKIYKLIDVCKPDAKELKAILPDSKAVVVRYGFPLSVEQIRKKYSILEGEDKVIFAVKLLNDKNSFVITEKIA